MSRWATNLDERCPHCGAWGHTDREDCEVFPAEEGPEIDDVEYDAAITVARELGHDPYDPRGEYRPDVISMAIAEIERRRDQGRLVPESRCGIHGVGTFATGRCPSCDNERDPADGSDKPSGL